MNEVVVLKHLSDADLDAVARIHRSAFLGSVFSWLGQDVCRAYYGWQLNTQHNASAIGLYVSGTLAAYCFHGVYKDSVTGFVYTNRWFLVKKALLRPWLLLNPELWDRFRKSVRMIRQVKMREKSSPQTQSEKDVNMQKSYGILSIATAPGYSGRGYASLLLHRAENEARAAGYPEMCLTVSPDNAVAIAFYVNRGWNKVLRGESWTGRMVKRIDATSAS